MSGPSDADIAAVLDTLRSGWLTMGPRIAEFEERFAEWTGARHAIAVSSGSAALHLAIGAHAGPGEEVVVPGLAGATPAATVGNLGATAVGAAVLSPEQPVLDPDAVAARIGPATAAVVACHAFGFAADTAALAALGRPLVLDRRGALGIPFDGTTACCSFADGRVLAVGEGGMVVTDDDTVAERVRLRRSHAMTSGTWDRHRGHAATYDVVDVGFNFRLDEPRAALGQSRLARIDDALAAARARASVWADVFADVDGVRLVADPAGAPDAVAMLARDRIAAAEAITRAGVRAVASGPLLVIAASEDPARVAAALAS